jgi:predicted transcriptional regulator
VKQDVIITIRLAEEIKETIQSLADKDERTLGWMARKLILEALEIRNLLNRDAVRAETGEHDSRGKTAGKDRIAEEIAAYGRVFEGEAYGNVQERMLFLAIPALRSISGNRPARDTSLALVQN